MASSKLRTINSTHILYGILILLFVTFSILSRDFLSAYNITSMLANIAYTGILTGSMALLMISGCIDLSVGGAIGLITSIMALLHNLTPPLPTWLILIIGLGSGVAFGTLNGLLVTRLRLNSIIVTLGTLSIAQGLAYVLTGGISVQMLEPVTAFIGLGNILRVPTAFLIFALFYAGIGILLARSKLGRKVYYIGLNERAANLAGVNIAGTRLWLFVISGFAVGLSSLILIGQSGVGMPQLGTGSEMEAITAALLGGVAFAGGKGTIPGILAGGLIIGVLYTGFTIIGVQWVQIQFFQGIILVLVVALYESRLTKGRRY
jgi:ribose transport system permease protein